MRFAGHIGALPICMKSLAPSGAGEILTRSADEKDMHLGFDDREKHAVNATAPHPESQVADGLVEMMALRSDGKAPRIISQFIERREKSAVPPPRTVRGPLRDPGVNRVHVAPGFVFEDDAVLRHRAECCASPGIPRRSHPAPGNVPFSG